MMSVIVNTLQLLPSKQSTGSKLLYSLKGTCIHVHRDIYVDYICAVYAMFPTHASLAPV